MTGFDLVMRIFAEPSNIIVIAGLDPAIHVDALVKPAHDNLGSEKCA
jgi:hypothetical protein